MTTQKSPRINLRIALLCAMGLLFGIFLFFRISFGGLRAADFLVFALFFGCAFLPFSLRRAAVILFALVLFGGAGAGLAYARNRSFLSGPDEGSYAVTGTVTSFTVKNGYTDVLLGDLSFDGENAGGKLSARLLSESVRAGDVVRFESKIGRNGLPAAGDSYAEYLFSRDIRYFAGSVPYERIAKSKNFLLRLNAALYDCLEEDVGGVEAQIAYALLTGNSQSMDEGLLEEVRSGGIAHIFAVSGLHIGILYGAVLLLFRRPLKKYAFLPAIAAALLYSAFCAFTVSSLRAVVMCAALGVNRAFGRKPDFLSSLSFAVLVMLLFDPADWLSAGFRLSFGACLGLALFSGPLSRLFGRIPHFPAFLTKYFSANLAVQLFTAPILLETFGSFSVWGFLLNLFFIPLLPVFFLTVLLGALLALCIPPAGFVFLALPKGLLSLFVFFFAAGEFTLAVTGFSLGAGALSVYLAGCLLLSERFRLRLLPRALLAGGLAVLFSLLVVFENVVFAGGKISVYTKGSGSAALVQTRSTNVLVIDGDVSLADCRGFLARKYGGRLDAVVVLADDEVAAINCAAFLPADAVFAKDEVETGLRETPVVFGGEVCVGELVFHYYSREKVLLSAQGTLIEIDFEGAQALGADFFVEPGSGGLIFSFENGIIKRI